METKYKQIEFDIELAKKIQAGEVPGKIVMREWGRVRIVCFDYKGEDNERILALYEWEDGYNTVESAIECHEDGRFYKNKCNESEFDLFLCIPDASPKHEFKPFDKVLWRDDDDTRWSCGLFSHYTPSETCPYALTYGWCAQCIPFNEETEHLLGTKGYWKE